MCWNSTGSPPPAAWKKLVPKNRSVNNIVTPPASTGIASNNKYAVMSQVQTNIGIFRSGMPGARRFMIVTMMLIAARIDETPRRWTAKTMNGNASPVCSTSGGYMVQPAAGPPPGRNSVRTSNVVANGNSQNDQLLSRGSAMSGAPIMSGIIQFANPAKAGMIMPNTITSACTVVI